MEAKTFTFEVIKQTKDPYSPEGAKWTKYFVKVRNTETDAIEEVGTFIKALEPGSMVDDAYIEASTNPDWLNTLRRAKKEYTPGSGGGGGTKTFKADPERTRISVNQTSLKAAVDISVSLQAHAKPHPKKKGAMVLAGSDFDILKSIVMYFKQFQHLIEHGTVLDDGELKVATLFNADEVKDDEKTDPS